MGLVQYALIYAYSLPPGIGFLLLNQAATIDRFMILLAFPFVLLAKPHSNESRVHQVFLTIPLAIFLFTAKLTYSQYFLTLLDCIFLLFPFLCIPKVCTTARKTLTLLTTIIKISAFLLILSIIFHFLGINLSLIQISDYTEWTKSRGVLGGFDVTSFTGFFDQPLRLCAAIFFQYSLYIICINISSRVPELRPERIRLTKWFLPVSLGYMVIILASQARYPFLVFVLYFLFCTFFFSKYLKSSIVKLIPAGCSVLLIGLTLFESEFMYLFNNITTFGQLIDSSSIADPRYEALEFLFQQTDVEARLLSPLGPLFFQDKAQTLLDTSLPSKTWDDLNFILVYYFSYGYLFVAWIAFFSYRLVRFARQLIFVPIFYAMGCMQGFSSTFAFSTIFLVTSCIQAEYTIQRQP